MADRYDIQRLPSGLTDLLGMRATGDTPHTLADSIFGAINMDALFLLDRRQTRAVTTGIALPGIGIASFPQANGGGPASGFVWFVYGLALTVPTVAAAASIQTHCGVLRQGVGGSPQLLPGFGTGLLAAGSTFTAGLQFEGAPLILRPGDTFAMQTGIYTGAPAVTPTLLIHYAELAV